MKLIVGLGNPGKKYVGTPHNAGFMLIDQLKTEYFANSEWFESAKLQALVYKESASEVLLAKTTTFMNESGRAVSELANYYKISKSDIYVAHDDLDLPLGSYKIQFAKGPKDHNGLNDIYERLGTKEFWHIRLGVDQRAPDDRMPGQEYVLKPFSENQLFELNTEISGASKELMELLSSN